MFIKHKGTNNVPQNQVFNEIFVKKNSYLNSRKNELQSLGATDAQLNQAFTIHRAAHNTSGNVQINYLDSTGQPVYYKPKQQNETFDVWGNLVLSDVQLPFCRVRYSPEHITQYKPAGKYTQPEGSGVKAYFSALWLTFINPDTQTHQSDFSTIYITEGEFKAGAMCAMGLPTIGLSGINSGTTAQNEAGKTRAELRNDTTTEHTKFVAHTAEFLPELQSFIQTYHVKNVVLVHDADAFNAIKNRLSDTRVLSFLAAVTDTAKACECLNVGFSYVVGKNEALKGVDDLLLHHHKNKAVLNAITTDLATQNPKGKYFYIFNQNELKAIKERFYQSTDRQPDLEFIHDGYLSDLSNEAFLHAICNRQHTILKSGTGSGKTYFSYQIAEAWNDTTHYPTLITAPLIAIIEQQRSGNKNPKFGFCTAANLQSEIQNFRECGFVGLFVNYDNLKAAAAAALDMFGGYNLIVDESHQITTAFGYKPEVVRAVTTATATANKVLLMSATPSLLGLDSFYFIDVKRSTPPPTPQIIYHTTGVLGALVETVCTVKPRSSTQQIVLLNNKKRIKKAQHALEQLGYKVAIIYTDNPDTEAYTKLINSSLLDPTNDVIICTEKVATGLNIANNGNKIRMIYCETNTNESGFLCGFSPTLYTQFVARVRDLNTLSDVTIITKELPTPPFDRQTANMYYVSLCKQLQKTANEINEAHPTPEAINYLNFKPTNGLAYDGNGKVVVDRLWAAHRAEATATNYAHITDYFSTDTAATITTTEATAAATAAANTKINEAYSTAEQATAVALQNPDTALQLATEVAHTTADKDLKKYLKNEIGISPTATTTTTEIQTEVATTALIDFLFWHKFGIVWSDAHKLTFRPETEKIRPNHLRSEAQRNEYKAIISRYAQRDNKGCVIRAYANNAAQNAKEALLKAFEYTPQLTAKQIFEVVRKHKYRTTQTEALLFAKSVFKLTLHTDNKTFYLYSLDCEWNKATIEKYLDVILC